MGDVEEYGPGLDVESVDLDHVVVDAVEEEGERLHQAQHSHHVVRLIDVRAAADTPLDRR